MYKNLNNSKGEKPVELFGDKVKEKIESCNEIEEDVWLV